MSLAQPEVEHVRGLIPRTYHNSPPFFASFESARQRPELNRGGLLKRHSSWYLLLRPQQQRYILCCEESDLFHSPWCKLCRSGLLFLHPHNPHFEHEYRRQELKREKEKTDYCNSSFFLKWKEKIKKKKKKCKQKKTNEKREDWLL